MPKAVRQVKMDDFSGGIQEKLAASDFTQRQWAELRGLVLTDELTVEAQWPCQPVGSSKSDFQAVHPLVGRNSAYLVGVDAAGAVWWTVAPGDTESHAAAGGATWTQLATADDGSTSIDSNPDYRFVTDQYPLYVSGEGRVAGLMVHSPAPDTGQQGLVVYENASPSLTARVFTDFHPSESTDAEGVTTADDGKMPRAAVGCMWKDYLVLGNIQWKADDTAAFDASNEKPYPNCLWLSEPAEPDAFRDTAVIPVASPSATVVGLYPVDEGLIVLTTDATGRDGILMLRGKPSAPELVVLRGGMGASRLLSENDGHKQLSSMWEAVGSVVTVLDNGRVWHTNGADVGQLDVYGPRPPEAGGRWDHVASSGNFLLLSRQGRLLCMRLFEEDGAWTELVTPDGGQPHNMVALDDSIYFVTAAGAVWRYALRGPEVERGQVDGVDVDLTISTRTLAGSAHSNLLVHRLGLRASGGTLVDVTQRAGAVLEPTPAPTMTTALSRSLDDRDELVLQGAGSMSEFSVSFRLRGGVSVEQVTVLVSGRRGSR